MKKIIASPHAPKAVGPYSQAVETAGALYVSGQLPIDAETGRMARASRRRRASRSPTWAISSAKRATDTATW